MAVTIVNVSSTKFSIDGIEYLKNFQSTVSGDKVRIVNIYDANILLVPYTDYSEFTIGGGGYASAALLQAALLTVIYAGGIATIEGVDVLSTGEVGGTKFLREDGDGTSSWQTPAGAGDVVKVGTPVNNQIGVWTGDGTIEGNTGLTYDGTTVDIGNSGTAQTNPLIVYENSTAAGISVGMQIEQAGIGDAALQFLLTAGQRWVIGIDNDDGDKFKISQGIGLGTNERFTIDTSGNIAVSGTVDGIDIATDVAANTAKISNATHTGQVTGSGALTIVDRLEEDATVTGTKNIDWTAYETFKYILTGACTFSDTNLPSTGSKIITIHMTGNFAPTYPAGWTTNIRGTYDGTVTNMIVVEYVKSGTPFYVVDISQPD